MSFRQFSVTVEPDWQNFATCIARKQPLRRVHFIELFLDPEIKDAVCERFGLLPEEDAAAPDAPLRREAAVQRFLGYDYVRCGLDNFVMPLHRTATEDTAVRGRTGGRQYVEEHLGPITCWAEFESFPWPDPETAGTRSLEWFQENLPEDMCIIGSGGFAHFMEYLAFLMGYETLCYALCDNRELVDAISRRLTEIFAKTVRIFLQFDRVKMIWGSDDLGFRSGTLISPADLKEFVLPGHRLMAKLAHDAGRPYLFHSCGRLDAIMPNLIENVGIDAKHSFEDTIQDVREAKLLYGDRIALLGGIDVDFLCRATEPQIRTRVRRTLESCHPGGGYCLGTGNSVTNYIPLDNYLVMLDEGRRYSG